VIRRREGHTADDLPRAGFRDGGSDPGEVLLAGAPFDHAQRRGDHAQRVAGRQADEPAPVVDRQQLARRRDHEAPWTVTVIRAGRAGIRP